MTTENPDVEPAAEPDVIDDVTLKITGDPVYRPGGSPLVVELGGVDLLRPAFCDRIEVVLEGGKLPKAIIHYAPDDLAMCLTTRGVDVGEQAAAVLRRLGWTPPPPDVPPHAFVEQSGACVLYVGPHTVCGKFPEDPIHGKPAPVERATFPGGSAELVDPEVTG